MNILDKAIEKISPQKALQRESARWKLQTMRAFQNSGYDESGAARNKNSMRGWLASSKTPQEDIDKIYRYCGRDPAACLCRRPWQYRP